MEPNFASLSCSEALFHVVETAVSITVSTPRLRHPPQVPSPPLIFLDSKCNRLLNSFSLDTARYHFYILIHVEHSKGIRSQYGSTNQLFAISKERSRLLLDIVKLPYGTQLRTIHTASIDILSISVFTEIPFQSLILAGSNGVSGKYSEAVISVSSSLFLINVSLFPITLGCSTHLLGAKRERRSWKDFCL
jgi:hypothetical protein